MNTKQVKYHRSPGRWSVDRVGGTVVITQRDIVKPHNLVVVAAAVGSQEQQETNAKFMVLAVNNFDRLLEACKTAILYSEAMGSIGLNGMSLEAYHTLKNAVAMAEGEDTI